MTCNVVNRKWATLSDQTIKMQLNGFVMNTSIDKIDELFDEGIIRYVVNHVLYQLDVERQLYFEEDDKRPPASKSNTATIAEKKVYCEVLLKDASWTDYCQKGVRGYAWDFHELAKKDMEQIEKHKYEGDPSKGNLEMLEERENESTN